MPTNACITCSDYENLQRSVSQHKRKAGDTRCAIVMLGGTRSRAQRTGEEGCVLLTLGSWAAAVSCSWAHPGRGRVPTRQPGCSSAIDLGGRETEQAMPGLSWAQAPSHHKQGLPWKKNKTRKQLDDKGPKPFFLNCKLLQRNKTLLFTKS